MSRQLKDLTFEQWLDYVFDHQVGNPGQEWFWDAEADWWDCPGADTLRFLTQAFENADVVFQPFSDAQLNQGLWFIASNACSNHMFALLDATMPWRARQRCIQSIHPLFEQCFAKRCTPHLSHLDEPGASPLNRVCYMWWDIIPIAGQPHDPERSGLDDEILRVLASTLQLDSVPCQESALHGLGHWQHNYPKRVQEIIDAFMHNQSEMSDALRTYAISAYRGHVL